MPKTSSIHSALEEVFCATQNAAARLDSLFDEPHGSERACLENAIRVADEVARELSAGVQHWRTLSGQEGA